MPDVSTPRVKSQRLPPFYGLRWDTRSTREVLGCVPGVVAAKDTSLRLRNGTSEGTWCSALRCHIKVLFE